MPSLVVKTPPAVEPISLAEAKSHLRVDTTDDDARIQGYIRSARKELEERYERAIITQSLVLGRDYFPYFFGYGTGFVWTPGYYSGIWASEYTDQELRWGYIALRPPVQSITQVTYVDSTGAQQTWANTNYGFDGDSEPGRLFLLPGKSFPTTAQQPATVKIEFVAGTSPEAVPDDIKEALLLLIGDFYENREDTVVEERIRVAVKLPYGVEELMSKYSPTLLA